MGERAGSLLFTIVREGDVLIARIFAPPNGARRDWEFGPETYVEALSTVLNTLNGDGWSLNSVVDHDDGPIYVMT